MKTIEDCQIRNYSIYLRTLDDGKPYLFGYFEYHGTNFAADMERMAANPATQRRWWALCKPCQQPLANRDTDDWWTPMDEVFHVD